MKRSWHRMTRRAFAIGLGVLGSVGASAVVLAQQVDLGKPVSPEVQKANIEIVNAFCATFKAKDIAKAASLLDDNVVRRVTQRQSLAMAVVGKDAVVAGIKAAMDRGDIEFKVLRSISMGPIVLDERDDFLPGANGAQGRWIRIHAGMFLVDNGKILEWTDYRVADAGAPAPPFPQVDLGQPVTPDVQKANIAVVDGFNGAFKTKDYTKAASLLADNVMRRVTQRQALAMAQVGKEAVAAGIKTSMDTGEIDFRVLRSISMGPIVLDERDDLLPGRGGAPARTIRIHAGMFFVDNGKIVEWTDYRLQ